MTTVRARLAGLVAGRAGRREGGAVVVFALDGVGRALAARAWRTAAVSVLDSVFPTVSSAAWLSSLTGKPVAEHGIPGVVCTVDGRPTNIYDHHQPLVAAPPDNVFSDAAARGIRPVAVLCDLAHYPCSWRDLLLTHAETVEGTPLFTTAGPYEPPPLDRVEADLRAAVAAGLSGGKRALVWCFVEIDTHLHHCGEDEYAVAALRMIERIATDLVADGHVVAAHSDHGHTPTTYDPELARLLDGLADEYGFAMGGAGRTRWLYPRPGTAEALAERLRKELPADIGVEDADEVFPPGSPARARVGDLFLVAAGEKFLAPEGYRYEHGSRTEAEVEVPFAVWGGEPDGRGTGR
ncbi:alkaline phosphatase family protein [Amycolatopsis sp. WGS_07]|uniref:alkaline phosphatase family protein n=1 Tax=Amycolatopsis sp. WGS_07 TaxID=3076764 RepID=UPI003873AB6A